MFRKLFFLVLFLSFGTCTFAAIKDSIGVTRIDGKLHIKYLVTPGETIYRISTNYHVPISDLLEINPALEDGLKVGQVINIPYHAEILEKARVKEERKKQGQVHVVQPGETLYGLSKKYNVSLQKLLEWNGMELKAGQEVIVGDPDSKPVADVNTPPDENPDAEQEEVPEEDTRLANTEEDDNEAADEPDNFFSSPENERNKNKNKKQEVAGTTGEGRKKEEVVKIPDEETGTYDYDPSMKQVLIIPFDPYLYFSDADAEIAAKSQIPMPKVRSVFRRRLNALIRVPGYENIHLLGGRVEDSISDVNKIYSSVSYHYQKVLYSPYYEPEEGVGEGHVTAQKDKNWFQRQKEKIVNQQNHTQSRHEQKTEGEYFGVEIKDPEFFEYFREKYSVDYYIFVNQFEVKTNYENCLDRAAQNYERTFTTHYSIFDEEGEQVAGNKFRTHYNSNSNYVYTIVADNMDKIASRILKDIPPPNTEN